MPVNVSIIIPTYKRPALLMKCLHSLLSQNFPKDEYEIIVVTDGPDEQTNAVVLQCDRHARLTETGICEEASLASSGQVASHQPFSSRLFCYSLSEKKGPAAARNTGWKIARGKFILFTDDDCIPALDWVQNYYNAFTFYPETLIAFTGKIIVPTSRKPTDFEINTAHLETADFVTANCACTKAALEMVNGFDEAFTMAWREDSDLEFKFVRQGIPIIKIEEAEVIHPVRKAPWGVSLKEQKKSMFDALLFKKHPELYKERIRSSVMWNYLFMILLLTGFFIALIDHSGLIAMFCLSCWIIFQISFITKRLSNASHSFRHITEMIATSILIPFFSVFWNLYGSYKFKVLHL